MGADLVTFSGAKHIYGPPGTGLLCGRKDLVEACRLQAGPEYGIGRPMKVGKEEIVGLITALEMYVEKDHEAERREWESKVRFLLEALAELPHVEVTRIFPDEVGRPVPRARVWVDEQSIGVTAYEIAECLYQGDLPVRITPFYLHEAALVLNPLCLQDGEKELVVSAFQRVWGLLQP